MLGGDPAKRSLAERIVAAGRTRKAALANDPTRPLYLSDRAIQELLETDEESARPNEVERTHSELQSEIANAQTAHTKPISDMPKSMRPVEEYADTETMKVQIKPRCLREALDIPFLRMIEKMGRILDDSAQREWLDDAEQRLRSVISRIDPVPVSYGYIVESVTQMGLLFAR